MSKIEIDSEEFHAQKRNEFMRSTVLVVETRASGRADISITASSRVNAIGEMVGVELCRSPIIVLDSCNKQLPQVLDLSRFPESVLCALNWWWGVAFWQSLEILSLTFAYAKQRSSSTGTQKVDHEHPILEKH